MNAVSTNDLLRTGPKRPVGLLCLLAFLVPLPSAALPTDSGAVEVLAQSDPGQAPGEPDSPASNPSAADPIRTGGATERGLPSGSNRDRGDAPTKSPPIDDAPTAPPAPQTEERSVSVTPPPSPPSESPGEDDADGPSGASHGEDDTDRPSGASRRRSGADGPPAFSLLGETIPSGRRLRLTLRMGESFAGAPISVPVTITHGTRPGPTVCLVAGVHGDELNGVEIVRRTVAATPARGLRGTLIGIPIANLHGLQRGSRYLPDRRDLNRYFPGSRTGSAASRIADVLFRRIVQNCDLLVDFHTGSLRRTNLSQLRADLMNPAVADLAVRFGDMPIVYNQGRVGTLRRSATDVGIASVTYEAGEPMRFDEVEIDRGVERTRELLRTIHRATPADEATGLFWSTRWVRVDQGGILMSRVELGDEVDPGDVLGTVTNPIDGEEYEVVAPSAGRLIGMAVNQVVIPGFAAYHLGLPGDRQTAELRRASQPPGEDGAGDRPPEDDDAS